jgi:hypothetical protein
MKNLLIIVFCKINYNKIEEKGNVDKTFIIVLLDFVAFGCYISLFAFATFGRSSYGRLRLEFSKLEERKR